MARSKTRAAHRTLAAGQTVGHWTVIEKADAGMYRVRCAGGTERMYLPHQLEIRRSCEKCRARSLADRFWERVDKSGECWIWKSTVGTHGYGRFTDYGRRQKQAHRVAFELEVGPIPLLPDGSPSFLCHHCDNRLCVRPSHMFIGDILANNADRHAKGRTAFGERSNFARYDADTIRRIYAEATVPGVNRSAIARKFGLSFQHVHRIARGECRARDTNAREGADSVHTTLRRDLIATVAEHAAAEIAVAEFRRGGR